MTAREQPRPRPDPRNGRSARDPLGQVLPDRAREDDPAGWGDAPYDDDERLLREVPPHHG